MLEGFGSALMVVMVIAIISCLLCAAIGWGMGIGYAFGKGWFIGILYLFLPFFPSIFYYRKSRN